MNNAQSVLPNGEAEGKGDWPLFGKKPDSGPNPYLDHPAAVRFLELYTGTQRRNSKLWMEYFTSDAFLDAAWSRQFAALLLEQVTRLEGEFPPGREFLTWLYIAYQFSAKDNVAFNRGTAGAEGLERQVSLYPGAEFDGMGHILKIAAKGAVPKPPKGNELAILQSFLDYRHLVRLAEAGVWNEQTLEEYRGVVNRYVQAYIRERCEQRVSLDCERHPAGLRVFIHFFTREDLPEEVYYAAWERLDLRSAVMGRAKVLYGPLRELIMERFPGTASEKRENYFQLNQARDACYSRIKAHPEWEKREVTALFSRPDLQKALRSRQFVAEQLLPYYNWLNLFAPEGVVRRIVDFYRKNRDIPGWDRVVEDAEQELGRRAMERWGENKARVRTREAPSIEPDLSLLQAPPERVYAQTLDGPEQAVILLGEGIPEKDWEPEEERQAREVLEQRLKEWIGQFSRGELKRLEIYCRGGVLVLTSDRAQYACFYFEYSYDTWYAMLSQPEVYLTVDCKDVEYVTFGMGRMPGYAVHQSPDSVMERLNLAFAQIGRGRPQGREGECWLWSSNTNQYNGRHKKRMAMQKLAGIPDWRAGDYILSKFVLSRYPVQLDSVTLEGERTLTDLRPGSYDMASAALVRFIQKKLAKLRLSWEFKGPEGGVCQRHIVLLQDGGRFMMAWLQDDRGRADYYASAPPVLFQGKAWPACLVHQDLRRIRNCLDLLLDDIACTGPVVDRPGEFVPAEGPYVRNRAELIGS